MIHKGNPRGDSILLLLVFLLSYSEFFSSGRWIGLQASSVTLILSASYVVIFPDVANRVASFFAWAAVQT